MRIVCTEQRTAEWYSAKVGRISASNIRRAMSKLKRASGDKKAGDWSAEHDKYVRELAWELITRIPTGHYVSKPMDVGTQYEGEARIEYWMRSGNEVEETGFILHPKLDFLGCSPDGLVLSRGVYVGGLELKVPELHNHEQYLDDDEIPTDYLFQCYTGMLCTSLPWWELSSYAPPDVSPALDDRFRLFRKRTCEEDAVRMSEDLGLKEPTDIPGIFALMEEAATVTMEQAIAKAKTLSERYPEIQQRITRKAPAPETYPDAPENFLGREYAFLDSHEMTP